MKRIVFVLYALFLNFITLYASEPLVVDKLVLKQSDLSASVNMKMDNNGQPCGLLKVITSDKSMSFEGSVVGAPEYKNGEYWVYLPAGTYQIRIKANGRDPLMLNFKDYNLSQVESKFTYELSFFYQDYDIIDLRPNDSGYWKIIQGPKLKKYAISLLALPYGYTINGLSSLDYLKRLASLIAREGDCWGDKYTCTILADIWDPEENSIYKYRLIIESTDDEGDAILSAAAGHGFDEEIFLVKE